MIFLPMMYQAHDLGHAVAGPTYVYSVFMLYEFKLIQNHFSQFACLCCVLCSSVVPFEPSMWFLLYSKQYNQHKTHLDGGKHKVHGCTLAWSQTSGFFSNYMLLEETTEQFKY